MLYNQGGPLEWYEGQELVIIQDQSPKPKWRQLLSLIHNKVGPASLSIRTELSGSYKVLGLPQND